MLKLLTLWLVLPLVALASIAACSPTATLNVLASNDSHSFTGGVAYGPLARQKLDIYQPSSAAPAGGWPTVVFFYGGSWNSGERAAYRFVAEALAARGVLMLVADYRLYPEVRYPEFLRDSALALAFGLQESARFCGNPKRVFVMGHSAGAYNAAMLALDARWLGARGHSPHELAGWIGLAGPYDFFPTGNPDVRPVFSHPNYPAGSVAVHHAVAGSPPSFLGVGRTDSLVDPQRNTGQMAARLQAVGVPVTYKVYDRANHVTLAGAFARPVRWIAPVLDDVIAFIDTTPSVKR